MPTQNKPPPKSPLPPAICHPPDSPFNAPELARCRANFEPLSPLSLIHRAASVHGNAPSVFYGEQVRLGRALQNAGIAPGDVVAVLLPNIPPFLEAMFGVPFCGAVINPPITAPAIARFQKQNPPPPGTKPIRQQTPGTAAADNNTIILRLVFHYFFAAGIFAP